MFKLESLITELSVGRSPEAAATLQLLAQRPEVRAIVEEEDARLLEQRRATVAELDHLPEKHRAAQKAASERRAAAELAYRQAQAALVAANVELMAATAHAIGLHLVQSREEATQRAKLTETADPRLQLVIDMAGSTTQIVRHLVVPSFTHHGRDLMGRPVIEWSSNADQVNAALKAIREVEHECRSLQQRAVSRAEVTAALDSLFLDLSALLAPFGAVPVPMLDERAFPVLDFSGRTHSQALEEAVRGVGGEPKEGPKPEPKPIRGRVRGITA